MSENSFEMRGVEFYAAPEEGVSNGNRCEGCEHEFCAEADDDAPSCDAIKRDDERSIIWKRKEPLELPEPASLWRHKNGDLYRVALVANASELNTRHHEYPITVVYRRKKDDTIWSRTLDRWHGSFTRVEDEN